MSGGLDLLIVGIKGKDLDDNLGSIATEDKLYELFGGNFQDDPDAKKCYDYIHALEQNPATNNPGLYYITGGNMFGGVCGTGLGYILFSGNNNAPPRQLDERIFARIPELKGSFIRELESHGINVADYEVGVHAINVYDT